MMIECLVYIMVLFLLLGVLYATFHRCATSAARLQRNCEDQSLALFAGERWRADVRAATARIELTRSDEEQILSLRRPDREITYRLTPNAAFRRVGETAWSCLVTNLKSSLVVEELRGNVKAWRWEMELQPRTKQFVRVHPLFTFMAVPERSAQ